ncbi:MAG: hypothetical protein IIV81_02035 [Clostridia bacterium]|nr:hypothetical protein [Clostridia bacterium]
MSAETVTLKIEEKARENARAILAEAQSAAEKKYADILAEAKAREEKILEAANRNADTLRKGLLQGAAQKAKLEGLKVRRALMDEVKDSALKKLSCADEKTLMGVFEKSVKESKLSGEFNLIPSSLHRKMLENNLSLLEKAGSIKIKISENDADLSTGFLLSSDIYDVDFSLDAILDELFIQNEKVIYDCLFESGEAK